MKITQKLDLNLHFLYLSLISLQTENYGDEINQQLKKFTNEVAKKTFDEVPHGFDITGTECILTTYLEK